MNNENQRMVTMGRAFKLFWTNYVNFKGTSSRSEYWWWYLWNFIIGLVLSIPALLVSPQLLQMIMNGNTSNLGMVIAPLLISLTLLSIYGLATLIPQIAILTRRIRDVGFSEGITITLVVANYALSILAFLVPLLYSINLIMSIAILVITILPTNLKKQR